MKGMQIQCRKCESVYVIDETKWVKLKHLNCPKCGEESYKLRTIIGEHKKPLHDIDDLIKLSKIDE